MQHVLTVSESNRLKGFLILLVILGHMGSIPLMTLFLLYSFHVSSFLFLPFLFNEDRLSWDNMLKILRRYYIPYVIFFLIAFVIYTIMIESNFSVVAVIQSLIIGTSSSLKSSIGFSLYWYFPTLISLLFLIMLYNSYHDRGKNIMMFIMIGTHLFMPVLAIETLQMTPFYLFAGVYLFGLGLLIKYIYRHLAWRKVPLVVYVLALAGLLYLAYGSSYNLAKSIVPDIVHEPYLFILHDVIMVVGFFTVVKISHYFSFLEQAGKYSIAIYTIHPFVIQLFNKLLMNDSIVIDIVKFILVALSTYIIVLILYKTPIYRYLYPR